jgi:hypothetical protein
MKVIVNFDYNYYNKFSDVSDILQIYKKCGDIDHDVYEIINNQFIDSTFECDIFCVMPFKKYGIKLYKNSTNDKIYIKYNLYGFDHNEHLPNNQSTNSYLQTIDMNDEKTYECYMNNTKSLLSSLSNIKVTMTKIYNGTGNQLIIEIKKVIYY